MKCPTCPDTMLVMSDRQGVEIDDCPQCRGIWLDRGELDKLLDRAGNQEAPRAAGAPAVAAAAVPAHPQRRPDFEDSDDRHASHGHGHGSPYRRKKSWLSEIFD